MNLMDMDTQQLVDEALRLRRELAKKDAAPVADGAVAEIPHGHPTSVVRWLAPMPPPGTKLYTHPHDASAVTEAMVERAMNASMPGGSTAWVWLFNCEGGMRPEDKHRDWFRRVLTAALPSPPKGAS